MYLHQFWFMVVKFFRISENDIIFPNKYATSYLQVSFKVEESFNGNQTVDTIKSED